MSYEIPMLICRDRDCKLHDLYFGNKYCRHRFIWFGSYIPAIHSNNENYTYICDSIKIDDNESLMMYLKYELSPKKR